MDNLALSYLFVVVCAAVAVSAGEGFGSSSFSALGMGSSGRVVAVVGRGAGRIAGLGDGGGEGGRGSWVSGVSWISTSSMSWGTVTLFDADAAVGDLVCWDRSGRFVWVGGFALPSDGLLFFEILLEVDGLPDEIAMVECYRFGAVSVDEIPSWKVVYFCVGTVGVVCFVIA